jgi:hypothetical protein
MTTSLSIMSGELGDIFWDLPPAISYVAGLDLGCSIYVANPTETEKEYALIARLYRNETLISEEALPVFGYTWFKVEPGDFVKLNGALRFSESDAVLIVVLVEKATNEETDTVTTQLVPVSTSVLPPWLGGSTTTTTDWSSLLGLMLPFLMLGIMAVALKPQSEKKEGVSQPKEEKKLLPAGRQD